MIPLTILWLPILLSAVTVFFATFIMHKALSYHKSNYRKFGARDRENETRPGGLVDCAAQQPTSDGKESVRRREWSDWESRHGRLSREGNGRESRAATEIQLYGGRPRVISSV